MIRSHTSCRFKAVAGAVLVILTLTVGCGGKYKSKLTEEEYQQALAKHQPLPPTTLSVSGEKVTVNDVVTSPVPAGQELVPLAGLLSPVAQSNDPNTFERLAKPRVENNVESHMAEILLYKKAKKEAPDKVDEYLEKEADRRWREFVLQHDGDEAKAEESLRDDGISRKQFKEAFKRRILSDYLLNESKVRIDRPISHKEYVEYYNQLKDKLFVRKPMIEFSLIDIQPEKLPLTDPTEDRLSQARALAEDLYEKLRQGASFADLAKAYSHGIRAQQGGRWNPLNPDALAPPYNVLAKATESMVQGEITRPIEVSGHVFIMKLESLQTQGYEPLEAVQDQIKQRIIYDRRQKAQTELLEDLAERASAGSIDDFVERCVEEIYQRSNQ